MLQRAILKDSDIEPLAEGVFEVLERVGVLCQNGEALSALDKAGAEVDYLSERARFSRPMVAEYVDSFRGERHAAEPAELRFTAPGQPGIGTQVAQLYYDHATREIRSSSARDMITLTMLGDVLHREAGVGHSLSRTDVPPLLEPLESGLLLAEYAHNPHGPFVWHVDQVDYLIEMGEILGKPNWFAWGAVCFAHPLRFDRDTIGKFVRRCREGESAGLTAMPVAGATTPITVEGFIVVAAAEHVATWITGRAINPEVSLHGSLWAGAVDMKTGQVSYSTFDAMFYGFACSEFLRRWCGMEVPVGGGEYCSAKAPGLYAALEKAYKAMTIAAFSGRHPSIGGGMLDDGKILAPVQLLIERDLSAGAGHLARVIEVTPQKIGMDSIVEVGIGLDRSHLQTEHTLSHFRSCCWLPELIDRSGWTGEAENERLLAAAQAKLEDLLGHYEKPKDREDQLAAMRKVIEWARKQLLG
ncbi:MAG: trimethylamine methyltransferase family protein [Candidatus Zipacnadales bacterium]